MAKNYQTEEMSLWWAWVPLKDFFYFLPLLSGNRNILFVLEQKLTLKHSILPISKKILVWSACHGSSVNYMVSDIVSSPISLYMQQKLISLGLKLKRDHIQIWAL